MTAQVARGTGARSTWIKVVVVTLIAAVAAIEVGQRMGPPPIYHSSPSPLLHSSPSS